MKYPKIRELKEAVISLVTPAYTSKFPHKPHIPFENFRGKPEVDEANCVGCETCANVCPPNAITIRMIRKQENGSSPEIMENVFSAECVKSTVSRAKASLFLTRYLTWQYLKGIR